MSSTVAGRMLTTTMAVAVLGLSAAAAMPLSSQPAQSDVQLVALTQAQPMSADPDKKSDKNDDKKKDKKKDKKSGSGAPCTPQACASIY